jgi:hypothetical protein
MFQLWVLYERDAFGQRLWSMQRVTNSLQAFLHAWGMVLISSIVHIHLVGCQERTSWQFSDVCGLARQDQLHEWLGCQALHSNVGIVWFWQNDCGKFHRLRYSRLWDSCIENGNIGMGCMGTHWQFTKLWQADCPMGLIVPNTFQSLNIGMTVSCSVINCNYSVIR